MSQHSRSIVHGHGDRRGGIPEFFAGDLLHDVEDIVDSDGVLREGQEVLLSTGEATILLGAGRDRRLNVRPEGVITGPLPLLTVMEEGI